jgi:hypothetical protein
MFVAALRKAQPEAASPKRRHRDLMEQFGGLFDNDKARHTVAHLSDIDGDYLPRRRQRKIMTLAALIPLGARLLCVLSSEPSGRFQLDMGTSL